MYFTFIYIVNSVVSGEIYTAGKSFTLPPVSDGLNKSHLSAVVYQIWQISGMLHTEWNDISLIRRKGQQLPWTTFCGTWRRDHLRHLSIRPRSFFQYHICQIFSSYKIFVNSIRIFVEQELIKSLSNLTSEDLGIEDLNLALNLSTRSLIVHHI